VDRFLLGKNKGDGANDVGTVAGVRAWTAAAGDVGVARKAKLYVTHSVNGTNVHCLDWCVQAISH
jgi:hypothetical protein